MNFDDNPQEAAYRAEVRAWIAANAPDMSALSAEERRNWHPRHKQVARAWQAAKADAGKGEAAAKDDAPTTTECPGCHRTVPVSDRHCRYCGRQMRQ